MCVLVVEDDKQLATALRRGLEEEGYAVDIALDGTEGEWFAGREHLRRHGPRHHAPGLPGDELCARRREAATGRRS